MSDGLAPHLCRKLDELAEQHAALTRELGDPALMSDHRAIRSRSIRRAALEPLVSAYQAWRGLGAELDEMRSALEGGDAELAEMAREEIPRLESRQAELEDHIRSQLVSSDDAAIGSIILEIRPGVGGDEAALWAGDLLAMYTRFAAERGWQVEEMELAGGEQGGVRLAVISIAGEGVYRQLAFESGTHQVKRVPATEAQGRIHTSTATVAVLPEPDEIEVELDEKDVRELITTAQGPGGQNVNKVATAVHLIHEPTGVEVRIQETKSQARNRERAWKLLRARLFERQKAEQDSQRAEARSSLIGSASRAEKIRTYRYKENLAVDHRLGQSFNLQDVLAGDLDALVEALIERETAERLAHL